MLDMRVKAPELLDGNTMREAGMKSKGPRREEKVPEARAVNPRHKGANLSDVARALMRPKDPKIRRTLEERRSGGRAGASGRHSRVSLWRILGCYLGLLPA